MSNLHQHTRSDLEKEWGDWIKDPSTFQIGIWGTVGSGKTVFLAILYDMLQLEENWDIVPSNDKAQEFVEQQIEIIRQERRFPEPTALAQGQDGVEMFRYAVQYRPPASNHTTFHQMELCVVDAPGEFYEDPRRPDFAVSDEQEKLSLLDYLSSCHGIIFLLDPERDKNQEIADKIERREKRDHPTLLRNLMNDFYRRSKERSGKVNFKLEQYMAFCVTKVDKEPYWREWREQNDPEKLAQKAIRPAIVRRLKNAYCQKGRLRFFATSSIGRYPSSDDPNTWQENVTSDRPLFGGVPQPGSIHASENPWVSGQTPPKTSNNQPTSGGWGIPTVESHTEPPPTNKLRLKIKDPDQIVPENVINIIEPLQWLIESIRDNPPRLPNRAS